MKVLPTNANSRVGPTPFDGLWSLTPTKARGPIKFGPISHLKKASCLLNGNADEA